MADFPTLSVKPDLPLDPDGTLEDSVVRSDFEGGYEQTRQRFTRQRRSWGLKYNRMPAADVAALRAWESGTIAGGAEMFTWTHPRTGTSYSVRIKEPVKFALEVVAVDGDWYSVEIALREV